MPLTRAVSAEKPRMVSPSMGGQYGRGTGDVSTQSDSALAEITARVSPGFSRSPLGGKETCPSRGDITQRTQGGEARTARRLSAEAVSPLAPASASSISVLDRRKAPTGSMSLARVSPGSTGPIAATESRRNWSLPARSTGTGLLSRARAESRTPGAARTFKARTGTSAVPGPFPGPQESTGHRSRTSLVFRNWSRPFTTTLMEHPT